MLYFLFIIYGSRVVFCGFIDTLLPIARIGFSVP